jgi:uncharacterized membrane protein (DUF441 family)
MGAIAAGAGAAVGEASLAEEGVIRDIRILMEEGVVVSFPVTSLLGGETALLGGDAVNPLMEEGVIASLPVAALLGGEAVGPLMEEGVIASFPVIAPPLMEEGVIASLAVTAALLGGENVNPLALEGVVSSLLLGERPVKKPLFGMIL